MPPKTPYRVIERSLPLKPFRVQKIPRNLQAIDRNPLPADKLKFRRRIPVRTPLLRAASTVQSLKGRSDTVDQQTRQALKHDQFVDTTQHGLEWASQNRRYLTLVGIVVAAVIAILGISAFVYNHRSEQATISFGDAMQVYQTPIAAPGQQVPPGVKTFASASDRAKAANQIFVQTADHYGMTPSGRLAGYFAGLTYLEAGQSASAESALKQVASGWNSDLASLAKLALAQLYRQTSRDQLAIDIYNDLTAHPTTSVPAGTAQLQLADLYEAENKPELAKKVYATLKDKDAKGPAGMIAAQKLNPAPAPAAGGPALQ
jgi:predicted negative regulator of RcsB-dependent stress response